MSRENVLFQQLNHIVGVAFLEENPLLDSWIKSWDGTHPLLDIGCGTGLNARAAVDAGATVYATELDQNALSKLQHTNTYPADKLSFHYMKLPADVPFKDNTFSGILCAHVIHFLTHEEIVNTLQTFHRLLIPGGQVTLTCTSENSKAFELIDVISIKEKQRATDKDRMDPVDNFVGLCEKAARQLPPDHLIWDFIDVYKQTLPFNYFNFINIDQLAKAFRGAGFTVDLSTLGPAPYLPHWEHGEQDQVRLIARKQ